jgi:hypothetical protein
VDATRWHHLAASLQASSELLTLYLDGVPVAQGRVSAGRGNALPVEIGRNGPRTGKYFQGKLDDVRIWSVVRSASEIAAHYQQQLADVQSGLIANWKLDEPAGALGVDSVSGHDVQLGGGAAFAPLVHPW